jgi:hypothetical protein
LDPHIVPLSELAAAVAALAGLDAEAAATFVRSSALQGVTATGLTFSVSPAFDSLGLALDLRGPLLDAAAPRPAWLEALDAGTPSIAEVARRFGDLDEPRALLEMSAGLTASGADTGADWAIIVMEDALKLLGDPWNFRGRFLERFTPFTGRVSLSRVAAGLAGETRIDRRMRISDGRLPQVLQALRETLREVVPPEGPTKEAHDTAIGRIDALVPPCLPEGVDYRVVVSIGWPDGMPPDRLMIRFGRLPLDFVVSLIQFVGHEVDADRLGTLFGLCESEREDDSLWFDGLSLSFGRSGALGIRLHVAANRNRWFPSAP